MKYNDYTKGSVRKRSQTYLRYHVREVLDSSSKVLESLATSGPKIYQVGKVL